MKAVGRPIRYYLLGADRGGSHLVLSPPLNLKPFFTRKAAPDKRALHPLIPLSPAPPSRRQASGIQPFSSVFVLHMERIEQRGKRLPNPVMSK